MVDFGEIHRSAARRKMKDATKRFGETVAAAYPWLRRERRLGEAAFGAIRVTSNHEIDRRNEKVFGKSRPQLVLFGGLFVPVNEQLEEGFVTYEGNNERLGYGDDLMQTFHAGHGDMNDPLVENPDNSSYTSTVYNAQTDELFGLRSDGDAVMPMNLLDYPQQVYVDRVGMAANTIARATKLLGSLVSKEVQAKPKIELVSEIPAEYRS